MSNPRQALAINAIKVAAAIKSATRKEIVAGIEHMVFSYRERADATVGRGEMTADYQSRLRPYVTKYSAIPANLKNEAAPHASRLAVTMSSAVVRLQRHQSSGSLDSSKLARLAAPGLSQREFDGMAARAYRRRDTQTTQQRPKIGIAGDFAYDLRCSNLEYVPMLQRLILIITEACNISNLQCAAYGTRGVLAGDPTQSATAIIKDFDDELNGATYGLLATELPFSLAYCSCSPGHGSMNGNGGVDFARAQGANFVIAIGNFPKDGARADCIVPPDATIQQAVDIISVALEARD